MANCELEHADYESFTLEDSDPHGNTQVKFSVPLEKIKGYFYNDLYYATVNAVVNAEGFSKSKHVHKYKIMYNTVHINPATRTIIDKSNTELKQVFIWIVIPACIALIVFVMSCRYCLRNMRYQPIDDARHLVEESPSDTSSSNAKGKIKTKRTTLLQIQSWWSLLATPNPY